MKRPNDSPCAAALIAPTPPRATLRREVVAGHSNNGVTSDLTVHIGLGLARRAYVTIKWPSGIIQTWPGAVGAYTDVPNVTRVVSDPNMVFDLDPNAPEPDLNQFHVIEELTQTPSP